MKKFLCWIGLHKLEERFAPLDNGGIRVFRCTRYKCGHIKTTKPTAPEYVETW